MTKVAEDIIDDIEINDEHEEGADNGNKANADEDDGRGEPEDAVESLRRQIKQEEDRRKAAEEQLRAAHEEKANIQRSSHEKQLDAYDRAFDDSIALKKKEIEDLEEKISNAMDEGDHKLATSLQTKLYRSVQDYDRAEAGKRRVGEIREQLKAEQNTSQEQEEYTPAAKKWIDEHPRFTSDDEYQAEAIAAHHVAVRKGIKMDSPEYFKFIEGRLEKAFPDGGDEEEEQDEPVNKRPDSQARSQSMAAPSRSGSGEGGGRKTKMRLTADEVEAAEVCGMSPEEYWQDKYGKGKR